MTLSMIKSLKDTAEFTKALIEYLSLKNKVLYSGTAEWNSGSKIIANITKYQTIKVYPWDGYDGITLERVDSRFKGTGFATGVSSGSHTSLAFVLKVTQQDEVTIEAGSLLHHTRSTSHSSVYDGWIKKIVGIEPIIPDALKNLGGGYCVAWLGGGLRAKLKTVLARCSQRLAEDFRWHAKRQFENWITTDSMGKYVDDYSFWSECSRQIYRFSSEIFTYSCCVWTMHIQHKLSGFVQYHNKHYFNNSFFDGIQEQLCDKVYDSSCLDRNRQSVTPRGCCCA